MAPLDRASRRPVLITGSSGRVGQMLTAAWQEQYALSLVDQHPPPTRTGIPFALGDVSSLAFVKPLCAGVDTVVHLAGLPSPLSDWRELRHHNVRSMWAALRAARDAGCRRLVFASSVLIQAEPARPYSRAKLLGERLGRRYAEAGRLSVICLRLGRVVAAQDASLWPGAWYLPRVLIEEDAIAAFTLAVEASPTLHSETFTVISANRRSEFDISEARTRLGYAPRMDAFALADRRRFTPRHLARRAKAWLRSRL